MNVQLLKRRRGAGLLVPCILAMVAGLVMTDGGLRSRAHADTVIDSLPAVPTPASARVQIEGALWSLSCATTPGTAPTCNAASLARGEPATVLTQSGPVVVLLDGRKLAALGGAAPQRVRVDGISLDAGRAIIPQAIAYQREQIWQPLDFDHMNGGW